ncbi:MAG: 23S rRNA (pseudouridine(1915)-N(3))-methyltransferase RlmH [Clostridiales Family XIII bacterium]|jgi:23S rRNA (pseudouridine1915-N3)-methyltransferase|nr:23S rRNA (pseudouridine(1915)-N(3))-methyltransferase RlmH [Clostridiales Family XIII bacterium]
MNIDIVCVGALRERYWRDAAAEYAKRLSPYCKLSVTEAREAARLPLEHGADAYLIALDVRGGKLSSEGLASKMEALALSGKSRLVFFIGGADGLSSEVLDRVDMRLSFSDMTFPHQLMRVILLEQIYRAFKIQKHEPYHK